MVRGKSAPKKGSTPRSQSLPPTPRRPRRPPPAVVHAPERGQRSSGARKSRLDTSNVGREVPRCNYVAMDRIWRINVEKEQNSAKQWQEKWGFLTTPWHQLVQEELEDLGLEAEDLRGHHQTEIAASTSRPEAEVSVDASPPVPLTSSGMIGWRSADRRMDLEKFGTRSARPISRLEEKLRVHWSEEV